MIALESRDFKRIIFLIVLIFISCVNISNGNEEKKVPQTVYFKIGKSSYFINDVLHKMDAPVSIYKSRTMVPLKYISEAFGGEVIWNSDKKMAEIFFEDKILGIYSDKNIMYLNNEKIIMDINPLVIDGRLMLPVAYVANALDLDVNWNNDAKVLGIIKGKAKSNEAEYDYRLGGKLGDVFEDGNRAIPKFPERVSYIIEREREFDLSEGYAEKVSVLMYHHILPRDFNRHKNNTSVINLESFEEQMKYLYENNFVTLTLKEFESFMKGELKVPKKSVLITFDDGYQSKKVYGKPVLEKYGFNGVVFFITNSISKYTRDFSNDILSYKSLDEIHDSLGVFEYGGHTHNLHRLGEDKRGILTRVSYDVVIDDLFRSKSVIDSPYFAYPYGHYDDNTISILENMGYNMAFTIKKNYAKPMDNIFEVGRFGISPNVSFESFQDIVNGRWDEGTYLMSQSQLN